MKKKTKAKDAGNKKSHEYPLPGEINPEQKNENTKARNEADKDMDQDAELTAHNKNDDLDEGESARLGEDNTGLI